MKNYIIQVLFKDATEFIHLMVPFVESLGSTPLVSNRWQIIQEPEGNQNIRLDHCRSASQVKKV